jgi:hypothetical protein
MSAPSIKSVGPPPDRHAEPQTGFAGRSSSAPAFTRIQRTSSRRSTVLSPLGCDFSPYRPMSGY